jgi:hypothetical protein
MSESTKQVSRRFTQLFSTGDEQLAEEILSPDVVFTEPPGTASCVASTR